MNGLGKCMYCEADIARVKAEGRAWTEVISHIPNPSGGPGTLHIVTYYCGNCWAQQQARMFG